MGLQNYEADQALRRAGTRRLGNNTTLLCADFRSDCSRARTHGACARDSSEGAADKVPD